jgi:phasin family protein
MATQLLNQWPGYTTTDLASLQELADINIKLWERFFRQQLDVLNTSFEAAVRGTQAVTEAKDYKDFLARQSAVAAEYSDQVLGIARKTNTVVGDIRDELTAWAERQVDETVNRTKTAAKKAA